MYLNTASLAHLGDLCAMCLAYLYKDLYIRLVGAVLFFSFFLANGSPAGEFMHCMHVCK